MPKLSVRSCENAKLFVFRHQGHWAYQFPRETGSVLCPVALWDCFGEAITSLIGYYKVAEETGSEFVPPKKSHGAIQLNKGAEAPTTVRRAVG